MEKVNRKLFFDLYRTNLDPDKKLDQKEVNALDVFLNFYERDKSYFTLAQWAYVFATVFHETNATFLPTKEAYWLSESWRLKNLRYSPFYGRGYVQITWEDNYRKYSKKLGIDLVKNPDLAMEPENAWFITIDGFKNGVFTGKKMEDYINSSKTDYVNARRIINGIDKAQAIAAYTTMFKSILSKI